MAKDAKFEISYFNEQTLLLLSRGINEEGVDENMKHYIELITKKEYLTYEYFLERLKQYAFFPDYTISTPCTHQEVPSLANAAYHNPGALTEEL